MKRSFADGLVIVLAVVLSASTGHGQITFNSEGFVTAEGGSFFLTLPEIRVGSGAGAVEGWVKWKLNLNNNAIWEVSDAGLNADIPKLRPARTANGMYLFNAQKGLLVMNISFSNFLGCGIDVGIQALDISGITATELTFTPIDPAETGDVFTLTCTRGGGIPGDIVGVWSCDLGPQGSMTVDFRAGRTVTFTGNMLNCQLN